MCSVKSSSPSSGCNLAVGNFNLVQQRLPIPVPAGYQAVGGNRDTAEVDLGQNIRWTGLDGVSLLCRQVTLPL